MTSLGAATSALPPIVNADGSELSSDAISEKLANKRVALYFAAGWCPMCTSFEPALLKFREAAAEAGTPVEMIYVPSDRSESDQTKRASAMNMLTVPFDKADNLKLKYKIWSGAESSMLGVGRRSGVPALVVLDGEKGEEMTFIAAESQGVRALGSWPLDDKRGVWDAFN
jgi:nucleoredoxin